MLDRLTESLLRYADRQAGESPYATPLDGMLVLRADRVAPPRYRIFKPCLCVVAQGAKWATFGESRHTYRAGEALVVGVETPSVGQVAEASPEKPCLVLVLALDPAILRDAAQGMAADLRASEEPGRATLVIDFSGPLAECTLRLVRLLDTPEAIPTIAPLIMRELCYWLLRGPQSRAVARMALAEGAPRGIVHALDRLRARFAEPVRMSELAAVAHLSPSAFHRHFKALTSFTPLQYQKQLRLLEARRLMVSQGDTAETAARRVGYESASQFSREYARLFGQPPRRHARRGAAA